MPKDKFAQATERGTEGAGSFAPNMFGDLLRAYRGVRFSYLLVGDGAVASSPGTVALRNTKIAENNSAIPRTRVAFRYNYFSNALRVGGVGTNAAPGTAFRRPSRDTNTLGSGEALGFFPVTREYDVNQFTLQFEKAFLNQLFSVEFRLPFTSTLNSSLDLVGGVLNFTPRRPLFRGSPNTEPTPDRTLGDTDQELSDTQLIFKSILMQEACKRWTLSSGLGVSIPTGEDLDIRVVDYSSDVPNDFGDIVLPRSFLQGLRPPLPLARGVDQRIRLIRIQNETVGLSPFLAFVSRPSDRVFVNAFAQVDVPLNKSRWTYRERDMDLDIEFNDELPRPPGVDSSIQSERSRSGRIRDQVIMHLDIGGGYWMYQNPCASVMKGVAGLLELHYTSTLNNADIQMIDTAPIRTFDSRGGMVGPFPAQVGNLQNRIDILNLTVGSTLLLGNRTTLGTALTFPLLQGDNRTFDWEFQVQLNVYFGRGGIQNPFAPSSF